ncbi:glucokinase [uncultured Ferrimonas sp.]|uniref:glucokinase n=1 Tax=uncultured Ferrimonas sp. TaxID=432640 RepID=UPI00262EB54B|nr:glucokinase [uncultured Ferrimonas sp.]
MNNSQQQILVADIGGTNARFAIAVGDAHSIELVQRFASADCRSLADAVAKYLATLPSHITLTGACLAVAGPVTNGEASLTNLGWLATESQLSEQLGVPVRLINDFVAYAYSVPLLPAAHTQTIKAGTGLAGAPLVVLGPGTGFGVASLQADGSGWRVNPCEGGHIGLAATSELQARLLGQLQLMLPYVNVESVLCGSGMINLYRAMAILEGQPARYDMPAQLTNAAANGDPLAQRTVLEFCRWLGSVAGDLVLAHGARGGVWLGGGILPRIVDSLCASDFTACFGNKGLMVDYLTPVPVILALKSDTAVMGAAAYYLDRC